MKSVEQILSRLESLSGSDRQWIVERLPDDAKALLMNELSAPNDLIAAVTSGSMAIPKGVDGVVIERVPPHVAANILENESGWLIAAILSPANKAWSDQVVNALPTHQRLSVLTALKGLKPVPVPVVMSLHNTLLRRIARDGYSMRKPLALPRWRRWRRWLGAFGLGDAA